MDIQDLQKLGKFAYEAIIQQREFVIKAFIAQTGLKPDEVEQVIQLTSEGHWRWYLRKRQ